MRNTHGTIYVGIDVPKDKLAVAIAGGERGGEVLSLDTFDKTPASVDKLLKKRAVGVRSRPATKPGRRATGLTGRYARPVAIAPWSRRP